MYKVGIAYLLILTFLAGCESTRKSAGTFSYSKQRAAKDVLMRAEGKNITGTGFFIRNGRIISSTESNKISLYFTMKYSADGKYLISLRSKTGMEAFRVYLSNDTILVNDRLNRTVLYGRSGDFEKITGIPAALLKISIGDIFYNKPVIASGEYCNGNEIKLNDFFEGLIVNSTIDCGAEKLKSIVVSTGAADKFITIDYRKFRDDGYSVPKRVEVNDPGRKIKIIILIDKYLAPWVGEIEFIPGSGFKNKPLI